MSTTPEGLTPTSKIPSVILNSGLSIAFASMAVPLVIVLFWVSQPTHWRRPGTWLCLLAFTLLSTAAVNAVIVGVSSLMRPNDTVPVTREMVNITVLYLLPWICDLAITLRLFAIFPFRWTSKTTLCGIFVFPCAIKLARLGMAFRYLDSVARRLAIEPKYASKVLPINLAEYILHVCDTVYASVLFYVKLRGTVGKRNELGVHRARQTDVRLRRLLWVSVSCFFIPVLMSLARVVVAALGIEALDFCIAQGGLNVLNILLCTVLPIVGVIKDEWAQDDAKAARDARSAHKAMLKAESTSVAAPPDAA